MATPDIISALAKLQDPSTPLASKPAGYSEVLRNIMSTPDVSNLNQDFKAFVDSVLIEGLGIVAARPLLGLAVEAMKSLPSADDRIDLGTHALHALQARVVSFEEQDAAIREVVADAYQSQEEWTESAKMLQGINLDSSQRKISDQDKVNVYMRICRLYLEEDDTTTAEIYLNRAKNLIYKIEDPSLNLQFQLSQARISDARRRFLDASISYHTISLSQAVEEEERIRCLSCAITCAILAPAGPQRSRELAKLYKDTRSPEVPEYGILEKMFLARLLTPEEVERFASGLAPHQLATTSDGTTVLAKAVVEHNLSATSQLYANIGIKELGALLACDAEKAESYAAAMFAERRLNGHIDQVDGFIFFDDTHTARIPSEPVKPKNTFGREMKKWDAKVQGITEELERISSMLQAQHPEFARTNTVH